jgi:hypothetical protein
MGMRADIITVNPHKVMPHTSVTIKLVLNPMAGNRNLMVMAPGTRKGLDEKNTILHTDT